MSAGDWDGKHPAEPRWVLLHHQVPPGYERPSHWDFMLQRGTALWTWALERRPPGQALKAERLADHRLQYLDYEGPVSGDRGTVRRVAGGTFRWLTPPDCATPVWRLILDWPQPVTEIHLEHLAPSEPGDAASKRVGGDGDYWRLAWPST